MSETASKNKESQKGCDDCLNPTDILIAEFSYAQETAGQAMEDRHKMVNYYLIIVGVILNAVATLIVSSKDIDIKIFKHPTNIAIFALLLTLFIMGVLYLLKLIRLREAWYGSAKAMNRIKDYYHAKMPEFKLIPDAFEWTTDSLKKMKMGKCGTLFFYSALLIIFFDTLALSGGLIFLQQSIFIILMFFLASIILQIALYKTMLGRLK